MKLPKIGDKIFVPSAYYISHGSDDFEGGLATIIEIKKDISGGEEVHFVKIAEGGGYRNWEQHLALHQEEWAKEYAGKIAHPDPDINTPWIEKGDIVNGKVWEGEDIW